MREDDHERSNEMLVVQMNAEVLLALERQGLLGTNFRTGGEKYRGNCPWASQRRRSSGEVGDLNVVNADVGDLDVLGLVLTFERRSVQTSTWNAINYTRLYRGTRELTKNWSFISIDVQCNLLTIGIISQGKLVDQEYTYAPTALLTAV
jgi:hypothetical protein